MSDVGIDCKMVLYVFDDGVEDSRAWVRVGALDEHMSDRPLEASGRPI